MALWIFSKSSTKRFISRCEHWILGVFFREIIMGSAKEAWAHPWRFVGLASFVWALGFLSLALFYAIMERGLAQ